MIAKPNDNFAHQCLTIDEVCRASKLCRSQVYKLIRQKRLKARKIGKSTRILSSDFGKFLLGLPMLGDKG